MRLGGRIFFALLCCSLGEPALWLSYSPKVSGSPPANNQKECPFLPLCYLYLLTKGFPQANHPQKRLPIPIGQLIKKYIRAFIEKP